ncbi:MAG TPA: SDR family NAD(P)-dependent oxidoreductase [Candidatus Binatus sp.]|jgi:3-oxoacyl-[acyl-carrier protein] reductase|nr:SDR family NAD(P)-dependent oxidoreductase [Candidatus Binatus sp.]
MAKEKALEGKVAVVTGASRGIGLAVARGLGGLGAKLSLCARSADKLQNVANELKSAGVEVVIVAADVTSPDDIRSLVEETKQAFGAIDILVNNAGIGYFGPFYEANESNWDSVLDTNLKSVFLLSKAVAKGMVERRGGHIINIASLAGKNAFAGGAIYCASKWGLLGMTECMAEDLRTYGIRVSAICPGTVATDFSPHAGKDTSKMLQPEDIAHVVGSIVTQAPQSFISEVLLRPTHKP